MIKVKVPVKLLGSDYPSIVEVWQQGFDAGVAQQAEHSTREEVEDRGGSSPLPGSTERERKAYRDMDWGTRTKLQASGSNVPQTEMECVHCRFIFKRDADHPMVDYIKCPRCNGYASGKLDPGVLPGSTKCIELWECYLCGEQKPLDMSWSEDDKGHCVCGTCMLKKKPNQDIRTCHHCKSRFWGTGGNLLCRKCYFEKYKEEKSLACQCQTCGYLFTYDLSDCPELIACPHCAKEGYGPLFRKVERTKQTNHATGCGSGGNSQPEPAAPKFATGSTKCVECGAKIQKKRYFISSSLYPEPNPGGWLCAKCFEKICPSRPICDEIPEQCVNKDTVVGTQPAPEPAGIAPSSGGTQAGCKCVSCGVEIVGNKHYTENDGKWQCDTCFSKACRETLAKINAEIRDSNAYAEIQGWLPKEFSGFHLEGMDVVPNNKHINPLNVNDPTAKHLPLDDIDPRMGQYIKDVQNSKDILDGVKVDMPERPLPGKFEHNDLSHDYLRGFRDGVREMKK